MKKIFIFLVAVCFLLCGCGGKDVKTNEIGKPDTHSQYKTSFREKVGMDKNVVYLGMPRVLTSDKKGTWQSSDETIAYVSNNELIGLREGVVTISRVSENGTEYDKCEYAVTTFNDGKKVDGCFEIGPEGFWDETVDYQSTVNPEFLKTKINTIQDAIYYFQKSGFYYSDSAPILVSGRTHWVWSQGGEAVLSAKCGGLTDIVNAAAYLLENDFEDAGYIIVYGNGFYVLNWFYEDGNYYLMDFPKLLVDIYHGDNTLIYKPEKFANLDEMKNYFNNRVDAADTMAVIMVPSLGHSEHPALYMDSLSDSSRMFSEHVEMGLEDDVYDEAVFLYENKQFDYSVLSIETEDMPVEAPRYGNELFFYSYE